MKFVSFILIIGILFQPLVTTAEPDDSLIHQAEEAYLQKDFKAAVGFYQQLLDRGARSSEVYFNLGNAYYQLHDLGNALLSYRRAALITPRDEDLRLNLARIRVQRIDGITTEDGILGQIGKFTSDWLSLVEMHWLVISLWWLCCGFIAIYLQRADWRHRVRWIILVSSVLLIIVSAFLLIRIILDTSLKPAVVIKDTVSVMTGPGNSYVEIFELHAASEIRIVEERNNWVRFQLPDLREGWIEAQAIVII